MKPKIALLARINNQRYTVNMEYVNALEKAGADVILLLPKHKINLETELEQCDGLCIPGGDDINPKLYDEENLYSFPIQESIDQLDLDSIEIMVKHNKPIFGICRGLQILNIYFGGTLYQDINKQTSTKIEHSISQINQESLNGHTIEVIKNSKLSQIFPQNIEVNSYHHQAIKDCAKNFRISATSSDGIIEAIEANNILAVQWHPERMTSIMEFQNLFNHFVNTCKHS